MPPLKRIRYEAIDQRWIPSCGSVSSGTRKLYHANSSSSGDNNTAYDNLNRLTAFRRGTLSSSGNNGSGLDTVSTLNSNTDSSQSYTVDAVGNQTGVTTDGTGQTNTVNSQNEETAAGSNSLAFDNNGNTTTDDQGHTLVYDAWNRLVAVKNGGTTLVTYAYDADGNRISQTASGTTTALYNSAAGQVLEERQGSTVTNQYVWSIVYVNALVLRDDNSSGGSYGKSGSGLGRRLYVQQDANFNVTALTDTSGTVKERMDYTSYGIVTFLDGTTNWNTTTDSYSWTYTFQGGRFDATSGMIHFGARDYSPSLGRWVQQDPAGYVNGANRYQMELDDPARYVDLMGTQAATTQPSPPNFIGVPNNQSSTYFPNNTAGGDPTNIFNIFVGNNAQGRPAGGYFIANKVKCKCGHAIIQKISNSTTYLDAQGNEVHPQGASASRNYIEGFESNGDETIRPDGHSATRSIPVGVSKVHYHVEITSGCGTYDGQSVNNPQHYTKFGEPGDPNKIKFDGPTSTLVIDFTIDDGGGYTLKAPQLGVNEHKP